VALHAVDQMAEEQVLTGDGGVGFHLADPVAIGLLVREEMILGSVDCSVQRGHDQ
jgi:hypothetical protein